MGTKLGVALGEYGGYMSFEPLVTDQGSWNKLFGPTTIAGVGTHVHSSDVNCTLTMEGIVSQYELVYNHAGANDVFQRWDSSCADTLHRMDTWAWMTPDNATVSDEGHVSYLTCGNSVDPTVAGNGTQVYSTPEISIHHYSRSDVTSDAVIHTGIYDNRPNIVSPGNVDLVIDDVVTCIDTIDLHPRHRARNDRALNLHTHFSMSGRRSGYDYGSRGKYLLEFETIPGADADMINTWWKNQWNLAFMLDTSDSSTLDIVRIVNATRPFQQFRKPYYNEAVGSLKLESINNGLWY